MANLVITIARGYGSNGKLIGKTLAKELGIGFYDRNLLREASEVSGISEGFFGLNDEKVKFSLFKKKPEVKDNPRTPEDDKYVSDDNIFNLQAAHIRTIAERESCVIVGRCADTVLKNHDNIIRIYIYASPKYCIKTIMDMYGVSPGEAEKLIRETDKERSAYYEHYTGKKWNDFSNYDLCLSASTLGVEKCVSLIKDYIELKNS
ncbi:MAG: cytidylate kinase-like family protein [Lachnospiraceae bacterium]|nr:cytidylate kinase-like family protein [Lachnospiraceae bacterium]